MTKRRLKALYTPVRFLIQHCCQELQSSFVSVVERQHAVQQVTEDQISLMSKSIQLSRGYYVIALTRYMFWRKVNILLRTAVVEIYELFLNVIKTTDGSQK